MKKALVWLTSAALIASMFAGCSVSTDTGKKSDAAATSKSEAAPAADTGNAEEIKWMFWDDSARPTI